MERTKVSFLWDGRKRLFHRMEKSEFFMERTKSELFIKQTKMSFFWNGRKWAFRETDKKWAPYETGKAFSRNGRAEQWGIGMDNISLCATISPRRNGYDTMNHCDRNNSIVRASVSVLTIATVQSATIGTVAIAAVAEPLQLRLGRLISCDQSLRTLPQYRKQHLPSP